MLIIQFLIHAGGMQSAFTHTGIYPATDYHILALLTVITIKVLAHISPWA